jgi:ABC-type tungstate transport system substrate-binding protein
MDLLIDSFVSAIALVISLDKEMVDIVGVSLKVSVYSTLFASLSGL